LVKYTDKNGESQSFVQAPDLYVPSENQQKKMGWDLNKPNPIVVTGPILPRQCSVSPTGADFRLASKVMTDSMAFCGGTARGIGFLCSGLGYAGLPSDITKRLALQMSLILPLLQEGKRVSLKVPVCDVAPLYQSVVRWTDIVGAGIPKLNFVVALEDISKVHSDFRGRCVTSKVKDSIFVWVSSDQLPTVKAADTTMIVFNSAAQERISHLTDSDFIVVTPICSGEFFKHGAVFDLGNVWDFRCVFTNQPSVRQAGYDNSKMEYPELPRFQSPEELWSRVVRDNGKRVCFFLSPKGSYHPCMNLLQRPARAGALQMNSDGVWEYSAVGVSNDESYPTSAADEYVSASDPGEEVIEPEESDGEDDEETLQPAQDEEGAEVPLPKKITPSKEKEKQKPNSGPPLLKEKKEKDSGLGLSASTKGSQILDNQPTISKSSEVPPDIGAEVGPQDNN